MMVFWLQSFVDFAPEVHPRFAVARCLPPLYTGFIVGNYRHSVSLHFVNLLLLEESLREQFSSVERYVTYIFLIRICSPLAIVKLLYQIVLPPVSGNWLRKCFLCYAGKNCILLLVCLLIYTQHVSSGATFLLLF